MDYLEYLELVDWNAIGLNAAVLIIVLFAVYLEWTHVHAYLAKTSSKDNFFVTRVHRRSVTFFWGLFYVTLLLITGVILFSEDVTTVIVALMALLMGFFYSAMTERLCFVNAVGIGGLSGRSEMEIQWNEIDSYEWKNNVLRLTLKKKIFMHKRLKFLDSQMVVIVNERLKQYTHTDSVLESHSVS